MMQQTEHSNLRAEAITRIAELLTLLADALELPLLWKLGSEMQVVPELPERHRLHTCAFCNAVKRACNDHAERCMENDSIRIVSRAARDKQPFVHECHAGGRELVIPFFRGDSYLGTVLAGPFRGEEAVYAATEGEYARLPELGEKRERAVAALIARELAPLAAELRRELERELLPPDEGIGDERIREAVRYIRRNFRRKLLEREVCERCSLSESHFQHRFREQTTLSYREYVQRLRVSEAERLLRWTRLPIAEIAQVCNLGDQSRLTMLCRRYYQLTPGKIREG